ncbi:MAG TPA: hypothetical protein VGK87_15420 [Anaerolineae bacterium]|jgi:hypothetical protein
MNPSSGRNLRSILSTRGGITALLIVQVIALPLFPPESFVGTSQEWWLPVMLGLMVVVADVELIGRRSDKTWPWYLISFANGFNVLSRLMMVWPHATLPTAGLNLPNIPYIVLTIISVAISTFMLVFTEWPEVRMGLLRAMKSTSTAG